MTGLTPDVPPAFRNLGASEPKSDGALSLAAWRKEMPVTQQLAFLDHASVAPLSAPAGRAIQAWLDGILDQGNLPWPQWHRAIQTTRQAAARLVGARPEELALLPSTTAGINLVAEAFPWQAGDNLITVANEFPSNLYPWQDLKRLGVEARLVQPGPCGAFGADQIKALLDVKTRLIAVSWVGYATGFRCNLAELAELARHTGAFLFVDAIQGLGAWPLDVTREGVDCLVADGHKWLLGPEGAALCYIRPALMERLRPFGLGWASAVEEFAFSSSGSWTLKPNASRFEGGTLNTPGFLALGASLELLQNVGISKVASRIATLTDYAAEHLDRLGAQVFRSAEPIHRSGILPFTHARWSPEQIRQRAREERCVVSCRGGKVRLSPHGYNTEEDLDRLLAVLA